MIRELSEVRSFSDLCELIHHVLCDRENLVNDQFNMRQVPLKRDGRVCGMQFSLRGPRQVRLAAVWAADPNQVFCYDTRGERFLKLDLPHPIAIDAG